MRFVCLADTHNQHSKLKLPEGDVLVHAGDFCKVGIMSEVEAFATWFKEQPYKHKIVIAGNHDFPLQEDPEVAEALFDGVHYLRDNAITIEGLKIYGTPWQPWFYDWAFNLQRGEALREKWDLIPDEVDILVTHSPMFCVGDRTSMGQNAGCSDLRDAITQRIKPRYHICGHIHEGRGIYHVDGTVSINASCLDLSYRPYSEEIMTFDL